MGCYDHQKQIVKLELLVPDIENKKKPAPAGFFYGLRFTKLRIDMNSGAIYLNSTKVGKSRQFKVSFSIDDRFGVEKLWATKPIPKLQSAGAGN
jgi:hypothetical protein